MGLQKLGLRLSLLILFSFAFSSCTKKINAEAPEETYASDTQTVNKYSYIAIPLNISLTDIEKNINGGIKGLVYEDDTFEGDDLKFKIWKTNDVKLKILPDNSIYYDVPLKIWVEKKISMLGISQTPSTQFEIVMKFKSTPFIGAEWDLKTTTNSEGFKWVSYPKISVAGMSIPITSIVENLLVNNQSYIARSIDDQVSSSLNIKDPVLKLWNSLKEPIEISKEYNVWARVDPQDVLMSPLVTNSNNLSTAIAIKAYVHSSIGKIDVKPVKSTTLPPIKFVKSLPTDFSVYLYNTVTYSEAKRLANELISGQEFTFSGGRKVKVENIDVYGGENKKMVIQVKTSGDLEGTIFLNADPFYDAQRREVVLRNTKFDIKTKNILAKAASWFMEGTLVKGIENEFGIPVDPIFEMAKQNINEALNKEFDNGLKLNGILKEVRPGEVLMTEHGILTTVEATGNIHVLSSGIR